MSNRNNRRWIEGYVNNKRWAGIAVVMGLACSTNEVLAAEPTLEVELDSSLRATLILKNGGKRNLCFPGIFADPAIGLVDISPSTGRSNLIDPTDRLYPLLGEPSQWSCLVYNFGAAKPAEEKTISISKISLRGSTIATPNPLIAPFFVLPGMQGPARDLLGGAEACGYYPPGTAPKGKDLKDADKAHSCTIRSSADRTEAQIAPNDIKNGTISVLFGGTGRNATKKLINFGVVSCAYQYAGPLPGFVLSARRQRIAISSPDKVCLDRIRSAPIRLVDGTTEIQANALPSEMETDRIQFEITGNSDKITLGAHDWQLRVGSDTLGSMRAEVIEAFKVGEKLSVNYGDASLDALHSGESANGIAVVTPKSVPDRTSIRNTAELSFSAAMLSMSGSTLRQELKVQSSPSKDNKCSGNATDQACIRQALAASPNVRATARFWTVEAINEGLMFTDQANQSTTDVPQAKQAEADAPLPIQDWLRKYADRENFLKEASMASFTINRPTTTPLRAAYKLYSTKETKCKGQEEDSKLECYSTPEPILEIETTLAKSARQESLPLPIANAMRVVCYAGRSQKDACDNGPDKLDIAGRGQQIAIDSRAMEDGSCWLLFDQSNPIKNAALYGPQSLRVTVRRENAQDRVSLWPITSLADSTDTSKKAQDATPKSKGQKDPAANNPLAKLFCDASNDLRFQLAAPPGEGTPETPYVVTVELAAQSKQFAVYRSGTDSNERDDETRVRPQYKFDARLRPRGPFGWRNRFRTYVTIPVELSGLRFPASPVDLDSTSDSQAIQVVTPRVGLLLTLEPWDYNKSKNLWSIPARFQAGFNMFQIGKDDPAFSLLAGVSAGLPIFEQAPTQLQTSINVGAFYELDLRQIGSRFSPANQSHFLLSFNINVLSLLGSR